MKPIIMLCGSANSGKDTVGQHIKRYVPNCELIALADPIKDLGKKLFGFTDTQLYGASERRDEPDLRFRDPQEWKLLEDRIYQTDIVEKWVREYKIFTTGTRFDQDKFMSFIELLRTNTVDKNLHLSPRIMLQTLGTDFGRQLYGENVWSDVSIARADELLLKKADYVVITDGRFRNEILNIKKHNGMNVLIQNPDQSDVNSHRSEQEILSVPRYWYDYVFVNDKKEGFLALDNKIKNFCFYNITNVKTW